MEITKITQVYYLFKTLTKFRKKITITEKYVFVNKLFELWYTHPICRNIMEDNAISLQFEKLKIEENFIFDLFPHGKNDSIIIYKSYIFNFSITCVLVEQPG